MVRKKEKSFFSKIMSKRILLTIQVLVTVIFLFCVYILKIIPAKYYLVLVVVLVVLFLLTTIFITSGVRNKKKYGKKGKLFFSKLTSIIVTGTLVVGCFYVIRGNDFFSAIGSALKQTRVFNVYVLKDSKVESLEDLKKSTFGVEFKTDTNNMTLATSKIEEKLDATLTTKEFDNYMLLADNLYDGKVDCIIADQAYMSILETNHEHFEAQTKIIDSIEITEKLEVTTSKTNVTENPFIVYVTGIDTYGKVETVSRTDVNLLVCVNPKEKQVLMVSIPRDTEVTLASYDKMDKLTHSAMYGDKESVKTIEQFLDIKINYRAKTNFTGVIDIIDALGGVTVDSPLAFTTMHGGYQIKKGVQEMDGDMALCFVRERYAFPDMDFQRGRNQQILLKSLLNKAMSPKIITNFSAILGAVEGCFSTDMSSAEIKSLINMQLDDMSSWDMLNVQVSGEPSISYETMSRPGKKTATVIPDEKALNKIIKVIDKLESGKRIEESDVEGLN